MPLVATADEATRIAMDYVKHYYGFAFPINVRQEGYHWIVEIDISVLKPRHARVTIFRDTGAIEKFAVVDV